jgi:hypothetical protein
MSNPLELPPHAQILNNITNARVEFEMSSTKRADRIYLGQIDLQELEAYLIDQDLPCQFDWTQHKFQEMLVIAVNRPRYVRCGA